MSKLQLLPPLLATLHCSLLVLLIINGAAAAGKTGELTVIWGRNKDEGSLRSTCDTGLYTTVVISFLTVFGHGRYRTDLAGHPLAGVGADVKHCQKAKNVTVLLSIGGAGDQYSLPTAKSAQDVAEHLWHAYLGGGRRGVFRPFGDAVLDGVDLYIDHGGPANYDVLVRRLAGYRGKPVLLTATPRCVYPDANAAAALGTGLVRRIHPRFYGDAACTNKTDGEGRRSLFDWEDWDAWTSRFPASQVYVGLPAEETAADWINPESLYYGVMQRAQTASNYGGAMLWDRGADKAYDNYYGRALKDFV